MGAIRRWRKRTRSIHHNHTRANLILETLEPRVMLSAGYALTDLGHLGGNFTIATAINDQGQITGDSYDGENSWAFLWDDGVMTELPSEADQVWIGGEYCNGEDINNEGYIALTPDYGIPGERAAYYDGDLVWNIHGAAANYTSQALAISDSPGHAIVGYYATENYDRYAYYWSMSSGWTPLDSDQSEAKDVNNNHQVVGKSIVSTNMGQYYHATMWHDGQETDLDPSNVYGSQANAINNVGQVVGYQQTGFGDDHHTFVWDVDNGLETLGSLAGDNWNSNGHGINDSGVIVGISDIWIDSQMDWRAFVYENGEMHALEDLVTNLGDWELKAAYDVNNNGEIVGWGLLNGDYLSFLLTPVDGEAPTAELVAEGIFEDSSEAHQFSVIYSDDVAVDVSSLDNGDITVTGPGGYQADAAFVSVDIDTNGTPREVVYEINPPAGVWDHTANGEYTFTQSVNQVFDTAGNSAASVTLGEFTVDIDVPVIPEQFGAMITSHSPTTAPTSGLDYIDVTFDKTINISTFTANDVTLNNPDNDQIAINTVYMVGELTYRISFANQTEPGDYVFTIGPDILDTNGNQMNQDGDAINGEPGDDLFSETIRINPDALIITGQSPSGTVVGSVNEVTVTFSDDIAGYTFTKDDVTLTGPEGSVAIDSVLFVSETTWRIRFDEQADAGTYSLKVGPNIENMFGVAMDQDGDSTPGEGNDDAYTGEFIISASSLKVVSHSPATRQEMGIEHVDFTFSEVIDQGTFTKSDAIVTGPDGAVTISSVTKITSTKYRISFPLQTKPGDLTVKLGPDIGTSEGELMNQDGDDTPGEAGDDIYTAVISVGQQETKTGFVITSMVTNEIHVTAGDITGYFPLQMIYQNYGPNPDSCHIYYYLSSDPNVDKNDTRFYAGNGMDVEVGESRRIGKSWQTPDTPGIYYMKAVIHGDEETWSDLITIYVEPSDYTPLIRISDLQPNKTSVKRGESFVWTMTVHNDGPVDYISASLNEKITGDVFKSAAYINRWDGYDISGTYEIAYIPAGGSVVTTYIDTGKVSWCDDIEYKVRFVSNLYSNITNPYSDLPGEWVTITSSMPYWPDGKPDLVATINAAIPGLVMPGEEIAYSVTVTNQGTVASGKNYFVLYRSEDDNFERQNDVPLIHEFHPDFTVPALLPGQSVTMNGVMATPYQQGTYYLSGKADCGVMFYNRNDVKESNEDNNWTNVLNFNVGNAQATGDVTWPPVGEKVNVTELNEAGKDYIEVVYSYADEATLNGDEITLAGAGAENLYVTGYTKLADGKVRYNITGDYNMGPVDITIKQGMFTNNSNEPNAAETEGLLALPELSPFVLTYDEDQVQWDAAKAKFSYNGEASLAIKVGETVNPLISIEGDINYDNLKIHCENVTITSDIGDLNVPLLEGTLDIDLKEKGWSTIKKLPSQIIVGGALVSIDSVVFYTPQDKPTELRIQGAIKLPESLGGITISVGGPHKIVVAQTGASLTGGLIQIPDPKDTFSLLGYVDVKASGMSVEYHAAEANATPKPLPDRLRVRGTFVFPDWWEFTADLSKNQVDASKDNYIEISENGVEVKGAFSVKEFGLPGPWSVKEAKLGIDTAKNAWQLDTSLRTPFSSTTIVGGAGAIDGEWDYFAVGVDDLNWMIGTSPVFIQKIVGNVKSLSGKDIDPATNKPVPVTVGGTLGFTLGPEVELWLPDNLGGHFEGRLAGLELEGEINALKAKGYGKLTTIGSLITGEVVGEIDYSKVLADPDNPSWGSILVTGKGQITTIAGLFTGKASIVLDCRTETRLAAAGEGKVAIPSTVPFWGGSEIASGELLVKYNDDNDYTNDYLAGWGSVVARNKLTGKAWKFTLGAKIDLEGNVEWLGGRGAAELKLSYSDFEQSITKPAVPVSLKLNSTTAMENSIASAYAITEVEEPIVASAYTITEDTPWTLLAAQWENSFDDAQLQVVAPDGTLYDEAAIDASDNMVIIDAEYLAANPDANLTLPSNTKAVLIDSPEAGQWIIRVSSTAGDLGKMSYSGILNTPAPDVEIDNVVSDGQEVTITYTATDADNNATVDLYYDTDTEDHDGILVVEGLAAEGTGNYIWSPVDVPAGNYYIYAIAIDSDNEPIISDYSDEAAEIEESPLTVSITQVTAGERDVTIDYGAFDGDTPGTISFFYDTDDSGADGVLIQSGVTIPDGADTFIWSTSQVDPGTYYVYAIAHDGVNPDRVTYADTFVEVVTPAETEVPFAGSIGYTEADGTKVSLQVISGGATAWFEGDGITVNTGWLGAQVNGENLQLTRLLVTGKPMVIISASGGDGKAQLRDISGESIGMLMGRNTELLGSVTLTGSLGMMMVGDIADGATITTGAGGNGTMVMAGDIGEANFDLAGAAGLFMAKSFTGGSLIADEIGMVMTNNKDLGADLTARDGNISTVMASGGISGKLNANGKIGMVMARGGDFTGTARAAKGVGIVMVDNLNNAVISAGTDIGMVMTGDIIDSYLLAGYDIGSDCAFGLAVTGGGDQLGSGDVKMVMARGEFARSYIGAGVLPAGPLTNALPGVGWPQGDHYGSIGMVILGSIDPDPLVDFGLFAATKVPGALKSDGYFRVEIPS